CGNDCRDDSCGHRLLNRFKGIFRRHGDDCCAPDCCGAAPGAVHPAPAMKKPEQIPAPKGGGEPAKKMPPDEEKTEGAARPPAGLTIETGNAGSLDLNR